MTDLKHQIEASLAGFKSKELKQAAMVFLNTIGYRSEKVIDLEKTPAAFLAQFDHRDRPLRKDKALFDQWKSVEFLFQITDEEVQNAGAQATLGFDSGYASKNYQSYLFFALDLKKDRYTRTDLSTITREVNRLFDMPAMLIMRYNGTITFSVIDRRISKRDESRDVLEKVKLIKDIRCENPHRAHIEILYDLSLSALTEKYECRDFQQLHEAWRVVLDIEALNTHFYRRIRDWFFLARNHVKFPHDGMDDKETRNRTGLIRLLTRVIFCWFAREKGLVPEYLFDEKTADQVLNEFDPDSLKDGSYYNAILQNLFFPTLSVPLKEREFRRDRRPYHGRSDDYMDHSRFRYKKLFHDPDDLIRLFENIPFLNGGLFECLDYCYHNARTGKNEEFRTDGFSDKLGNPAFVPNALFFGREMEADLSDLYGSHKKNSVKIDGLFHILNAYKFTVAENTPIEQEIALDPELLGRIFEELLAEYNFDTEAAVRKATGSFYTPRIIVNYMVDASLTAHLSAKLAAAHPRFAPDAAAQHVAQLLEWSAAMPDLSIEERQTLADAIYDITVIDPACGSGAFPMGMLQKLIFVLGKLDSDHERWKNRILNETHPALRDETRDLLNRSSAEYTWKLALIKRAIYGIDIQPIAVQIAKLRCFIALLVDFDLNKKIENYGVPPLPNLDFKFVAANSLIRPPGSFQLDGLALEDPFFTAFAKAAEDYFFVRDPQEKKRLRKRIEELIDEKITERELQLQDKRDQLVKAAEVKRKDLDDKQKKSYDIAKKKLETFIEQADRDIADWESYRNIFAFRNQPVLFFDIPYFFPEIKSGFDIVIGNPPYVEHKKLKAISSQLEKLFRTYSGTADLYVYFYEQGINMLKSRGVLAYISSNKFIRTSYGEKLRGLLSSLSIQQIIDFTRVHVFDALVASCILVILKEPTKKDVYVTDVDDTIINEISLAEYIEKNHRKISSDKFDSDIWQLEDNNKLKIKEKIESGSKKLHEIQGIHVYRGVTTGYNPAFVIDQEIKNQLIKAAKRNAEIIKPLLQGRNVKKWFYEISHDYLLFIPRHFPLHNDVSIMGASKIAEQEFQKKYSAIYKHLQNYKAQLLDRNTEETGIRYEWYALQRCANTYYNEFEKEKIIWGLTADKWAFAYDADSHYLPSNGYILTSESNLSLKYLLALLNSNLVKFYFGFIGIMTAGGAYTLKHETIIALPIKTVHEKEQQPFINLVARILAAKKADPVADTSALEHEIDERVYRLYGLTDEEIKIVEGTGKQ